SGMRWNGRLESCITADKSAVITVCSSRAQTSSSHSGFGAVCELFKAECHSVLRNRSNNHVDLCFQLCPDKIKFVLTEGKQRIKEKGKKKIDPNCVFLISNVTITVALLLHVKRKIKIRKRCLIF
uniref:Uncharacterized protein n=1 Tax=Oryzias latipes TaxID=8090 RepID=A0A3P9L871_ORYLA